MGYTYLYLALISYQMISRSVCTFIIMKMLFAKRQHFYTDLTVLICLEDCCTATMQIMTIFLIFNFAVTLPQYFSNSGTKTRYLRRKASNGSLL